MAKFNYIATDRSGSTVRATVEAEDREGAVKALRKQGMHPLSVEPIKKKKGLNADLPFGNKVKTKELVIFTRQLATLVNAGVPLARSLSTLQGQASSPALKKQLASVVKHIEGGSSLSDALAEFPKTFPEVYVNMVKAGEEGGILDEVLRRLAVQQEKDAAIRSKIKSAMTYPGVILVITAVAFVLLMTSIVPKIGDIVKNIGGEDAKLPIYTEILLKISDVMKTPQFLIGMFIVTPVVVVLFRKYIKTPKGKYQWASFLLKVPIVKVLLTKVAIARFARTFSALMGAGVPITDAINTTSGAVGNAVIAKELTDASKAVEAGEPLSKQLEKSKVFPPLVSQMLAVGEETGQTDQILVKVAEFYEEEVDAFVNALASIIEPVMIVILGSIVGVIAASVFGPISQLSQNIK